jgi:hypothetical protein
VVVPLSVIIGLCNLHVLLGLVFEQLAPSTLENSGTGRPQPVFLAELLDDDSVVEFYEDFARLA